ncbi:ABC transporter ATP-binding protein [Desulfovibrio mangrovi]|uniref:ABC transporter ATP-binding protein n=1 Tax=Desulfovibrio mangrovi TaxID=2976983 RepID=UPI002245DFA3|nr:ABC transporter ATP-binding protein [Desulfovibrio mangrovi]UZP67138.1 ABC transporter ATP-binding protein [Desulfovibrio mangrovi]
MITLTNVTCGYAGQPVLRDVNLCIHSGEMVGLLGPNGSGKTTLLLTLSGVLPPISGEMRLANDDAATLAATERAKRLASVPQRLGEQPHMEAFSLVLMGRYPYISFLGGYSAEDRNIALGAMQETRTAHLAHRSAQALSGGEFQRVLIARALAQQTPCLLLDEATSGLDIARKVEVFRLLHARHAQGTTVISAIHDLNMAALYCERLIFLKEGRIVLDGPVSDIFTEQHLSDIYETRIHIISHPVTGVPQACLSPLLPAPRLNHD